MKDLGEQVYAALDAVLPGRVYTLTPPDGAAQPCISFFELDNADTVFADDEPWAGEIVYAVDVWAAVQSGIPALAKAVDRAMKGIGFARIHAQDLPRDAFGMYHKNLQYSIVL